MAKARTLPDRLSGDLGVLDEIRAPVKKQRRAAHIEIDPEKAERGLAQLVLTLVDAIRELLERQAIRRVEGGTLSDEEIERLGETFIKLNERMDELKKIFDLRDEDLNIDLGPLGSLR